MSCSLVHSVSQWYLRQMMVLESYKDSDRTYRTSSCSQLGADGHTSPDDNVMLVLPDFGPLWKIPLGLCSVNMDPWSFGSCWRKMLCSAQPPAAPRLAACSALWWSVHPGSSGSPALPAAFQDTHSAPLQEGAGSAGSRPGDSRLSLLTLGSR